MLRRELGGGERFGAGIRMCRDGRVGGSTRGTPMRVWLGRGSGVTVWMKAHAELDGCFPFTSTFELERTILLHTHFEFELLQTTFTTTTTHHTSTPPS
jgi:hypothetical protein